MHRVLPLLVLLAAGCGGTPFLVSPPTLTFRVEGLDQAGEQELLAQTLRSLSCASEIGIDLETGWVDLTLRPGTSLRLSDLRICVARVGCGLRIVEEEMELEAPVRVYLDGRWTEWKGSRIPSGARNVEWAR